MANDLVPVSSAQLPALVDSRGRPLVRAELTVDVAGPTVSGMRSINAGHPADGLTPERLARLLRQAEQGDPVGYLELAEQMEEKDLHYLSVLGTRKRAVSQLPIEVDAASEDPNDEADAQLARDWLDRDTLQAELFDMLDAAGKGFSVTEIIWETGQLWLPSRLQWRDPRWFEFDRVDGETVLLRTDAGPKPLSAAKYIVHIHPAKSGLPIRGGLARPVAWAYLFRNFSIKDWVRFSEAYGMPFRMGRYENGTTEENIRKLLRSLASMSSDFAAAFPKSMEVDFQDAASGDTGELYERLLKYFEQQISKAVLGQTSTTDAVAGGLGSGNANVHDEVRGDIKNADARLLATTLNRDIVPWIVMFNRGKRQRYPRIRIGKPEAEDVKTYLDVVKTGVSLGVPVGVASFRRATGLVEPKAGEELLKAPAVSAPAAPGAALPGPSGAETPPTRLLGPLKQPLRLIERKTSAAFAGPEEDPDEIDLAADEALGDWQRMIQQVIAPIEALVAGAESLEQVRDGLAAAFAGMAPDQIVEQLAQAAFGARLAGDADTAGAGSA